MSPAQWVAAVNVEVGDDRLAPVLDQDMQPMLMPEADSRTEPALLLPSALLGDAVLVPVLVSRFHAIIDQAQEREPGLEGVELTRQMFRALAPQFVELLLAELSDRAGLQAVPR